MHDSAVSPCLHDCLVFLHSHFPLQSPPSCPLRLSPCSQQQTSPWYCSPVPMLQLPAAALSRGLASLSGVCMAGPRIVCVVLTPFSLSWICCFTLQQPQVLPHCPKQLPRCGDLTPASVLPPPRCRSSPAHSLSFFPSLLCPTEFCVVLYILFHWSGTLACSQLVFHKIFCVLRCVPDVSIEREVLHIHLLLHHLILSFVDFLMLAILAGVR